MKRGTRLRDINPTSKRRGAQGDKLRRAKSELKRLRAKLRKRVR